jgi:ribosomal protein S4E
MAALKEVGMSREVDALARNGDYCVVVAGTHAGKSGVVQDRKTSRTGHITITVQQADGVKFKTLARSVEVRRRRDG